MKVIGMKGIDYWHDHAAVSVPQLEPSVEWYCRVLGFAEEKRVTLEPLQARVAVLINGSLRIELFEVPGARPPSEERAIPDADLRTFGNKHVAFACADIEAVHALLLQRGADIVWMRRFAFGTNIFLRDNAGNLIEFVERARTRLGMAML
jgi:methylmalonyl-CoA/ethylmalonyl-CoA epimerase